MEADAKANMAGSGVQVGTLGMAARERTWDECGIEEKVERMREALLRLEGVIGQASKRAGEALTVAKVHEHGLRGDVLTPAAPNYRNELHFDLRHLFARLR